MPAGKPSLTLYNPRMRFKVEIWNIFVVSMLLMLLYAALNPACAVMNTALQDSNTHLTSKLGYMCQSVMSLVSMAGGLLAPPFRTVMGHKTLILVSALLHVAVYVGMIILTEWAVILGSVVTGLGEGLIWVVVPNFVTLCSEHKHIERNLSYHMFIYNFNGIAGNILNYLCLDDSRTITDSARLRYFTACTIMTVVATVLAGLAVRSPGTSNSELSSLGEDSDLRLITDDVSDNTKLLPDSDKPENIHPNENSIPKTFQRRCFDFMTEPSIRALTISNAYFGAMTTLVVIVPMCISNTFENRHLIPILGVAMGISRLVTTGLFDWMARMTSYTTLQYLQTITSITWVILIFLAFPNNSLHHLTPGEKPLIPMGEWVVYVLGILNGCIATWLGVLVTVATGKVSRDTITLNGFEPDVVFAYTMIVWSLGSSISLAITPYVSLYLYCCVTIVGILANHFCFCYDLLPFIGQCSSRERDEKSVHY